MMTLPAHPTMPSPSAKAGMGLSKDIFHEAEKQERMITLIPRTPKTKASP